MGRKGTRSRGPARAALPSAAAPRTPRPDHTRRPSSPPPPISPRSPRLRRRCGSSAQRRSSTPPSSPKTRCTSSPREPARLHVMYFTRACLSDCSAYSRMRADSLHALLRLLLTFLPSSSPLRPPTPPLAPSQRPGTRPHAAPHHRPDVGAPLDPAIQVYTGIYTGPYTGIYRFICWSTPGSCDTGGSENRLRTAQPTSHHNARRLRAATPRAQPWSLHVAVKPPHASRRPTSRATCGPRAPLRPVPTARSRREGGGLAARNRNRLARRPTVDGGSLVRSSTVGHEEFAPACEFLFLFLFHGGGGRAVGRAPRGWLGQTLRRPHALYPNPAQSLLIPGASPPWSWRSPTHSPASLLAFFQLPSLCQQLPCNLHGT